MEYTDKHQSRSVEMQNCHVKIYFLGLPPQAEQHTNFAMRSFTYDVKTIPNERHIGETPNTIADEKDLAKKPAIIYVTVEDFKNGKINGWLGPHNDRVVLI